MSAISAAIVKDSDSSVTSKALKFVKKYKMPIIMIIIAIALYFLYTRYYACDTDQGTVCKLLQKIKALRDSSAQPNLNV